MPSQVKLRVTWTRSAIGTPERHRATVRALGLRKLHQTVIHNDSPSLRGMLHAIRHLVTVATTTEEELAAAAASAVAKKPSFVLISGPSEAPAKPAREKTKPATRAAKAAAAAPKAAAAAA